MVSKYRSSTNMPSGHFWHHKRARIKGKAWSPLWEACCLGSSFQAMGYTWRLGILSLSAMGQPGRPWRRWLGLKPLAVCCLYFYFPGDHPKLAGTSNGPYDLLNGTEEVFYQIVIYFWNQQMFIGCLEGFIIQLIHRCPLSDGGSLTFSVPLWEFLP